LPELVRVFNVSFTEISLLMSLLMLGGLVALIPSGFMSDKLGANKTLKLTLTLSIPILVALFFATEFLHILLLRIVLGAVLGSNFVAAANYIAVWSEKGEKAKNQGLYGGFFGFGTVAAFVVSPITLAVDWKIVNLFPLLSLSPALGFLIAQRETPQTVGCPALSMKDLKIAGDPRILSLGTVQFSSLGLELAIGTWITSYFILEKTLISSIMFGSIVVLVNAFSRISGGYAAQRLSCRLLILLSLMVCTLSLGGLSLSHQFYLMLTLSILIAWFSAFTFASANKLTIDVSIHSGTTLGIVLFLGFLGRILLTTIMGYLLDVASFEAAFLFLALVTGGAATVFAAKIKNSQSVFPRCPLTFEGIRRGEAEAQA
jgi:nitrate/nitrite transporter NarK